MIPPLWGCPSRQTVVPVTLFPGANGSRLVKRSCRAVESKVVEAHGNRDRSALSYRALPSGLEMAEAHENRDRSAISYRALSFGRLAQALGAHGFDSHARLSTNTSDGKHTEMVVTGDVTDATPDGEAQVTALAQADIVRIEERSGTWFLFYWV